MVVEINVENTKPRLERLIKRGANAFDAGKFSEASICFDKALHTCRLVYRTLLCSKLEEEKIKKFYEVQEYFLSMFNTTDFWALKLAKNSEYYDKVYSMR